ncbi:MAG: hypothetical protein LBD94_03495, partial [Rickettsiales bacterium]|nr:hypothetical protein [Rickettsiales bacterium]
MDKAIDIYKEQLKHGIDPMRRFVGPEYEVLIPLSGLDRFEYDPAYGKDYRDFGIYNKTFSVNPQTYSAACVMNRLGRELGVRLRVTDAWRPIKIQIEKFILNKAKDPSGDVFANPFGKEFEFSLSQDKKFRLRFSDGNGRLDIFAIDATNTAMTRKFADKITNDRFLSKYLRPTPHSVGGAMYILLLDGKGNPLTQPKWLAKKLFQDLE